MASIDAKQIHRSLFEYNSDAVYSLDTEGRFTSVNGACEQITGYTMDQLLQLSFSDIVALEEVDDSSRSFRNVLKGQAQHHHLTIRAQSGERKELNVTTLPITEGQEIVGIFGIAKDVTALWHKDRLISYQNEILESIVRGSGLTDIFTAIVEALETQFSGTKAAIMLVQEDGTLGHGAFSKALSNQYVSALNQMAIRPQIGNCDALVFQRSSVVVADIMQSPVWTKYRSFAEQENLAACYASPVVSEDQNIVAVMCMYYSFVKDATAEEIEALETYARLVGMAIVRHRSLEQLHQLANTDPLTGLPNRRAFMAELSDRIQIGERLGLMFLDVDHFKWINDTLGHSFGDKVLLEITKRIQQCLDEQAIVGRLGGDEFAVLLEMPANKSEQYLADLAEALLHSADKLVEIDGHSLRLTMSIGTDFLHCRDTKNVEFLLSRVDTALYAAKNAGRNAHKAYSSEMTGITYERLMLERDLSRALEGQEFYLLYQPKYDVQTLQITGLEALIRWKHPHQGLISPDVFIPIAEQAGLIESIDTLVLNEVAAQLARWSQQGLFVPVSVNISQLHFQRPDFTAHLAAILERNQVPPGVMDIEITETAFMQHMNHQEATLKVNGLRALGVTLSIDDFGIGHSSLNLLRSLSVDFLKIDRSFIHDHAKPDIITAMIQLGHSLGMRVVAEGVEIEAELTFLKAQGCDQVQGYLLGKPMPVSEVVQLLQVKEGRQPTWENRPL